ncbi:YciI family protein [Amycolatopsis orientalis]|uniref:YciI family protein n=1 Tax=Amycolatopsis orientalis TaxID=31958 RepID=UPI0003A9260E|nr:YciI family protein [Amycolatopsis orientalis]
MTNFLLLYRADQSAAERLAQATPEEQAAGMRAWEAWFAKAGDAVVDGGAPTAGGDGTVGGYSIVRADSADAVRALLDGHPHTEIGTIDVLEILPRPGA